MPISSWVLTLGKDADDADEALRSLAADARVELGERHGARVPMVLDTATPEEDSALSDAIARHPGVASLLLVHLDFSDVDHFDRAAFHAARRDRRIPAPTEVQP